MITKDNVIEINPKRIQSSTMKRVVEVVKKGGVIVYPTDTIYGLGCDAFRRKSVERIFKIKKRSLKNPTLVLVNNRDMLNELVKDVSDCAMILMKRFWPGPLTIVFRARKKINPLLVSHDGKIAIRIPDNKFCLKLIDECKTPIVSTSANISGSDVITTFGKLKEVFQKKVDLMVDGGDLKSILPSTIVDVCEEKPVVLREGVISRDDVERCIR